LSTGPRRVENISPGARRCAPDFRAEPRTPIPVQGRLRCMNNEFEDDSGVRLMLAYQAGDESAFDRIVEEYSTQVFALLTRFLGQRACREDLVQEVFLRVIRSRERYQPTARFSTWLYRIVFNLSVNETQRSGSKESQQVSASTLSEERATDGFSELGDERAIQPSEHLEQADVVRVVRAAIAALPENQRMALILAKYEEMPYVEIAEILGSSEKAVKSLVHRARETLRESLAPYLQAELS
jgi:RNA polymerase sigma-70 factor (ECF subfamily)